MTIIFKLVTVLLSILTGSHCFASSRQLMQAGIVNTLQCSDWAEIKDGQDVFSNNVWGKDKLNPNQSYRQCLVQDKNTQDHGWYWNWQGCDDSVYAFPECFKGSKPWNAGASTFTALDGQLKSFKRLKAHIKADTYQHKGTFNFILEAWAVSERRNGGTPNQDKITHELMWYLHSNDDAKPAGSVIDTFRMNKVTWDVYYTYADHGGTKWAFYTFSPQDKSVCEVKNGVLKCNKKISVHQYFNFLQDKGYATGNEWIHGFEVGNEIMGGCKNGNTASQGTTLMRKFDVTVRK